MMMLMCIMRGQSASNAADYDNPHFHPACLEDSVGRGPDIQTRAGAIAELATQGLCSKIDVQGRCAKCVEYVFWGE